MDKGSLRSGQPDDHLRASISLADEAARALADQLYDFQRNRDSSAASELLCRAAAASADQVAGLAGAIAPSLGPSIARAWEWLKRFRLGLSDVTVGEPALEQNRSLWLRDLLRELARFDLPSHPDDALRWLAVYSGAFAQGTDSEITALISKLLGRGFYHAGTTGSDHVGRLLACEIAHDSPVAEDLLDTLKLLGTGRHPALPAEKQFVPSPHVARGLAGCGREDAVEILCDTITTDRHSPELSLESALQAAAAAVEVVSVSSTALVRVLETIANEISHGRLDRSALAEPLSSVLALPSQFLADPSCDVTLNRCAAALNDANLRALMIDSDDETDIFLGLWTLSVLDLHLCGEQLRERYEEARAAEREDTKLVLRTFARLRVTRTLAMRPLWLCMLSEALGEDSRDPLNLALTAEVLAFKTAAGLNTSKGISVPADTALDLLLELERRLRDPVLKEELVKVSGAGTAYAIDSTLASLIVANLAGRSVDCLLPLASSLDYVGFPLLADADFTKSNAQIRAIVFERASSRLPIGSRMMTRAVAAAESIDELVQWSLGRFERHSVDSLFALSCALRSDRVEFWRAFLSASKKPIRECGLKILIATLRFFDKTQRLEDSKILSSLSADIVIDSAAIRLDAAKVLDEYEGAQSAKKKGDDLKSHYVRAARELARSEVEADLEAAGRRAALVKLCEQVAQITGIDSHRFTPTASFGSDVQAIDASAIGHALSHDQVTLYELVWFLVLPDYRDVADNLISGVQTPERFCLGINAARDVEIHAVIQAVAEICRRQENSVDPSLPPTLANTWRKLPAPPSQATVVDALQKYAQTPYQVVGNTDDSQKAFVARLREALSAETNTWLLSSEDKSFDLHKAIDFDKVDAWQKSTRQALKELLAHKTISEEQLLRVAMHQPLLLRSVLEATGRMKLLEAAIWLTIHLGWGTAELAMTLDADTGHASLRRLGANAKQLAYHLVAHYVPDFTAQLKPFSPWLETLTIRRSWKQTAIDALPRQELKPLFDVLKPVHTAADRQRVEGWIAAMDGKLSSLAQREKLEASIKDRPNAALLQLALLPLPSDREAMLSDISRRLKIIEAITIAGRKAKSLDARENVQRAVDRVRSTLADNAGLAGPVQLDWLSGEAIAKELAEFKRIEMDDYVIALQLRSDGPHCVVAKGGKALKTLPAAVKSSEQGKRLIELQNRLKSALSDTRAVLEAAMLEQRGYTPDDLKMMLQHPVVATVASELLFVMSAPQASDQPVVGRPSDDGQNLLGLDGEKTKVTQPVRIAHPLDLDKQGVLAQWQSWFTDQAPQPFQQVERAFARLGDLEIIDDGTKLNRHDDVAISNEEQAFRVLQAHGWQSDREAGDICRIFRGGERGDITAILQEFLIDASLVGPIEFRDSAWNSMPIVDVPPIILSETVRDIDRTIEAVRK